MECASAPRRGTEKCAKSAAVRPAPPARTRKLAWRARPMRHSLLAGRANVTKAWKWTLTECVLTPAPALTFAKSASGLRPQSVSAAQRARLCTTPPRVSACQVRTQRTVSAGNVATFAKAALPPLTALPASHSLTIARKIIPVCVIVAGKRRKVGVKVTLMETGPTAIATRPLALSVPPTRT